MAIIHHILKSEEKKNKQLHHYLDIEKAFDKIHHPLIFKTIQYYRNGRNIFNMTKDIYKIIPREISLTFSAM